MIIIKYPENFVNTVCNLVSSITGLMVAGFVLMVFGFILLEDLSLFGEPVYKLQSLTLTGKELCGLLLIFFGVFTVYTDIKMKYAKTKNL